MNDTVLRAKHLTKRFGALTAVDGLSLDVKRGEVLGLLGPNGAGKTTAIRMLCGLLRPDEGEVFIHGQRVKGGDRDVVTRVGMCPQAIVIWKKLTCLEQLVFLGQMYGLPLSTARRQSLALLEKLGLREKSHAAARTLSGGMQRRLNLAAALVHDPDILVLDEPEAGLDPQSRVMVREYIQSLAREKTILLTTHNMDEADRVADRVAIIDHGRLLCLDTPDALKKTVGQGDLLEIEVSRHGGDALSATVAALMATIPDVRMEAGVMKIRAHRMVDRLPGVLDVLTAKRIQIGEVRLRATTLEDVFLALTGRSLRE